MILVVQAVEPIAFPGISAQQLLLLDRQGKILDRIQCHMNSRYGVMAAEIPAKRPADGAQIVLRFHGAGGDRSRFWHSNHTIIYKGTETMFNDREHNKPNEWDQKGLARIAVSSNGFQVVFPPLNPKKADERPEN